VASFTGSSNYSPVQSAPVPFTIAQGNATIVLTSSMGSAVHGQSVTFVATVAAAASGTPSDSVAFSDGGIPLATVALGGSGIAMLSTSSLALGTHSITAAVWLWTPPVPPLPAEAWETCEKTSIFLVPKEWRRAGH
jgi:hypothetical protein